MKAMTKRRKIRVLIVDDSAFVRRAFTKILAEDPRIEVVGTAWDGKEAIEKIAQLAPDVVTMDLNMPKMNGLEALDVIMRQTPVPVIVVSSINHDIIEETLEAIQKHGAIDFILKPTGMASDKLFQIQTELISKVITFASNKTHIQNTLYTPPSIKPARSPMPSADTQFDCVAIGVSTGGPTALYQIIPELPPDFPAGIVIVQHMPPGFTKPLAERMNKNSQLVVKEAATGDKIMPGTAYIAPGGSHLYLQRNRAHEVEIQIRPEPSDYIHIPSIDITFENVAEVYRERSLGIILTGMGKDGVEGLAKIKAYGGKSIAEDEKTCVVFGMPEVAIRRGIVDRIVPVYDIADVLMEML